MVFSYWERDEKCQYSQGSQIVTEIRSNRVPIHIVSNPVKKLVEDLKKQDI